MGERMKKVIDFIKEKSIFFLVIIFLLTFFLNWINVNEFKESGYSLLFKSVSYLFNQGFDFSLFLYVALSLFTLLGSFVSIFFAYFNHKIAKRYVLVSSIINFTSSLFFIFLVKKSIDFMKIIEVPFLIKYVSYGYYLSLVVSLIMLVKAMKANKINRGYITLVLLSIIWLFPIVSIVLTSFRGEQGFYSPNFIPKSFTFDNYIRLFTDTKVFYFGKWFLNTLFVAVASCILSTICVLSISFVLSRIKFKQKKFMMNVFLILGMFPGFMSMIAVYFIIKALGLSQSLLALIVVYSAGSGLGYYVVKGFFDTIPRDIDEAVMIDGGTKAQLFSRIIIPLSKPIIIYTILTSFISPWCDYIFASVILGDNYDSYTVAIGLFTMLENNYIDTWYTRFAAGAIIVALPIAVLFIKLRRFYVEGLSGSVKG